MTKITSTNDLDRLLEFLQDEVEGEERILIATRGFEPCKKTNHFNNRKEKHLTSNINKKLCIFCSEEHKSWNCKKAANLTLQERQGAVENKRCCFLCLRDGHGVKTCHSKMKCQLCGKKHHLFLCRTFSQEHNSSTLKNNEMKEPVIQHDEAVANLSKSSNAFLQTLTVLVRGENIRRTARAVIDSGSQRPYILNATAEEMKYSSKRREYLQHALFGGSNTSTCGHDVYTIYLSSWTEEYSCHFEGLGQAVICNTILASKRGPHLKELRDHGIQLAEDREGPIEILIGADIAGKLITGNHLQLKSGLTAIETKLGWTVIGRSNNESASFLISSMLTTSSCDLWALDSLGITDPAEKKTAIELQEAAKQYFLDTVKIENDRFLVSLPWIEGHLPLPDNFELSDKRLQKIVRSLKSEGLFESYENVLKEWLAENVIEEVPEDEIQRSAHYLPHLPVLKENSTTKIRPVFDASAKQKGAPSLNDCLESGINLIELIPSILFRFRLEKIGVISDIRKAFLQICLSDSDKDFLRFLWIGENGQLKRFCHCRLVFGVSSSPFLLGIVIMHHLQSVLNRGDEKYPENMIELLMKSFHVDNCVTSVSSELELKLFIEVATKAMTERKFDLRGWEYTNYAKEITPSTNVLGMQWDKDADTTFLDQREDAWGTFVQNRVSEIRTLTSKENWRHVPGALNPADLPSRGCSAKKIIQSRWWEGPDWLYLCAEKWPSAEFVANEDEILKEKKKTLVSSTITSLIAQNNNVNAGWYYHYFSKNEKIIRMIGWILRFVGNCRKTKELRKQGSLDAEEFSEAEKRVIKIIQRETFLDEKDVKLKTLKVYKDEDDIIRLNTKIIYREDSHTFTRPVILPSQHHVVKLLIFSFHKRYGHVGTQMLLNLLREHFWILNGRKIVRLIISKCATCKRHSEKSLDADVAPITKDRIRDASVFEVVGIDLAGPSYLKDGKKVWVCLFTCAAYRAVHFELVSDISTDTFLLALRRFVARRGRCTVIYCDNGTNFVGAYNLFKTLGLNRIIEDGSVNRIQWKFNPPTASWWGGWWERLVRVMKNVLKRVIGRACLTYEEMSTVLCDCESTINSRPLTYVSEQESEFVPLSPSLFLQDIKETGMPDCDAADHKRLNKRIKYRLALQKGLRKRFKSEYLGSLIQRPKEQKRSAISVEDVVLIGSDNQKRINWPLGRVIGIIPGRERIKRLVKLKTAREEILRPIQRLYPLEITNGIAEDIQA
ncbi:uncharacterized protein LOC129222896 [Uloborus diversus]|uniref:uncharacterized protein LOC129222896 n=1 Tax=Uloborus diversus TaxID=327109 RepID=UPI0024093AC3|nr:uncharacterized protein LOC129222896 [Uloborus diversus]